ncbi:MAG TPA: YqaA family protein [Candidatus Nanoarchaeia archaeon]|nr:YqaA family protein [Candidatus Nanoarchaeia archaeon]
MLDGVKNHRVVKGIHFYSFGLLRRLYNWTLSWADTKYGTLALFILAFMESSFFPIPPDILLIALCISIHKKSFKYAAICTVGSIIGGMFGYIIGYGLYESVGAWIIEALHYQPYFDAVGKMYAGNAFVAIIAAAVTPIPYKVFTIAAGVWKINFWTLVFASIVGRGFRFFLIASLIYFFGARIKTFIDKYFNLMVTLFLGLLVGGFLVIKYLV